MQYDEDFCVGETGTLFCRFGIERSCCHHECRACPVFTTAVSLQNSMPFPCYEKPKDHKTLQSSFVIVDRTGDLCYLSRVDLLAGEGVVVGTHFEICVEPAGSVVICTLLAQCRPMGRNYNLALQVRRYHRGLD